MIDISIFGVTGYIGNFTLEILQKAKNYNVFFISGNQNVVKMKSIIHEFNPNFVYMFDNESNKLIEDYCLNQKTEVLKSISDIFELFKFQNKNHYFINSIIGINGIIPSIIAQKYKISCGIANKESILILGELLNDFDSKVFFPLDSEHYSLNKLIKNSNTNDIKKYFITASGGVGWDLNEEQLDNLTIDEILDHPNWDMGDKITIDSSTGLNKTFELIEAHHLFNITIDKVDIFVNRSSNIHSGIILIDNSFILDVSIPDMKLSISDYLKKCCGIYSYYVPDVLKPSESALNLLDMDYNKFKVLGFVKQQYCEYANLGTKIVLLNSLLRKQLTRKEIKFSNYNNLLINLIKKNELINGNFDNYNLSNYSNLNILYKEIITLLDNYLSKSNNQIKKLIKKG